MLFVVKRTMLALCTSFNLFDVSYQSLISKPISFLSQPNTCIYKRNSTYIYKRNGCVYIAKRVFCQWQFQIFGNSAADGNSRARRTVLTSHLLDAHKCRSCCAVPGTRTTYRLVLLSLSSVDSTRAANIMSCIAT